MKDYTQVERDNAALTIREYAFGQMNMLRMLGDEDAANNLQEAINIAIAALSQSGWVRTSERLPAEADTGDDGKILCVIVGVFGGTVILHVFWGMVAEHPERYPYWMPIPKLPNMEDEA